MGKNKRGKRSDDGTPKKPKKPKKPLSDNTLIKMGLRKAFARCGTHRAMIESTIVYACSPKNRSRVVTWCICPICNQYEAKSYMVVDHLEPVQPLGVTLDEMDKHDLMDRIFCARSNLSVTCKPCHQLKSNKENKERRRIKSEKQLR